MMASGLLSSAAAKKALTRRNKQDLQFFYFLASVRTAFDLTEVRYRIICNPGRALVLQANSDVRS